MGLVDHARTFFVLPTELYLESGPDPRKTRNISREVVKGTNLHSRARSRLRNTQLRRHQSLLII